LEVAKGLQEATKRAMIIERLFKNPKTTILGLLILGLCFVLVFYEKATLTEVSAFLMGAFALMFLKDPNDGKATSDK
jgi:hypothetical protein